MQQENLVIPIYLDTNALLDLLASIEGGFSIVEKVTTVTSNSKNTDKNVKADTGTEFGIPNVLNMLKINIGYNSNWKNSEDSSRGSEQERYHTYGSLFHRLRDYLDQNELIKYPSQDELMWDDIAASDFVEIHGRFRPNPLVDSFQVLDRLINIFQVMAEPSINSSSSQTKKQASQNRNKQITTTNLFSINQEAVHQMDLFKKIIKGLIDDVQINNVLSFITEMTDIPNYKAVTLLYKDYLRDQTMKEINHKEYRILGKVIRKINNNDEPINLLIGTGLGSFEKEIIDDFVVSLNQIPKINIPEIQTHIYGPALEIVPIAIYI